MAVEIDTGGDSEFRNFLKAKTEASIKAATEDWDSHEEWNFVFEVYEEQFLWDLDYESTSTLDSPSEAAAHVRKVMGIDDGYHSAIPPDLDDDWELTDCYHRVLMSIDRKKTIRMHVTLTADVPASMEIGNDQVWGETIGGFFPTANLMLARGANAIEPDSKIVERRFGVLQIEHSIVEVDSSNTDDDLSQSGRD